MSNIMLRPSYWASVSGGKDSLYMLKLIMENPNEYPLDGVVHFELEIDYPFITNVIDYMQRECERHGIRFVRIKPSVSWYELEQKRGVATRTVRWCNGEYKLNAKKQLDNFLKNQGAYMVSYIGYCYDESSRWQHRGINKNEVYPLVDYEVCEEKIWEWAKDVPIFNDFYKYNTRCGCMYCPLQSMRSLVYLKHYYPDNYDFFMNECLRTEKLRESELGRPFSVWQSNPKYNTEHYMKMVAGKELTPLSNYKQKR